MDSCHEHAFSVLLCLSSSWIGLAGLDDAKESHHIRLSLFRVGEDIGALVSEHAGDSVEQVPLEAEGEGGSRVQDLFARLGNIDLLERLLGQPLLVPFTNSGNQPG